MAGEVAETFSNSITGDAGPASPSIAPQKPGIGSDVGKSSIGGSNMARAGSESGGRSKP
jgi:hypothetical protein